MEQWEQVVRHAAIGGTSVAWSAVGSGPVLVIGGWWSSHLELDWADDAFRRYVARLAEHRTVVRYDRPGTGASDRRGTVPVTLEDEYAVLRSLIDEVGSPRVALMGGSSGCAVASLFAAREPDRTEALVLYGGYVRGEDIASPAAREAMLSI